MTEKLKAPQVKERMIAKARASGLSPEDIEVLKFRPYTREAAIHNNVLPPNQCAGDGFTLPYFDSHGRPTRFFRFRYVVDTRRGFAAITDSKPRRYTQPGGHSPELYLCPLISWPKVFENVSMPLLVTEGELKASCACKHGMAALGLGGVWNFQSSEAGQALLPVFSEMELEGRTMYIVFDSDAVTNPNVLMAEQRLATRLTERGAVVMICRLPDIGMSKAGLDDYIMLHGAAAFKEQVLYTAFPFAGSEALHEMNTKVIYVKQPSCIWDFEDGYRMSCSQFKEEAYSDHFYDEKVVAKTGTTLRRVKTAAKWMEWPYRNKVKGLAFVPGGERITEDGFLNVWTGWGVRAPLEGDVRPWVWLLDRLFGDDIEARTYFERWCAYPLQHPGTKMSVAAALWGPEQGTGKTLVGHTLMRIYGERHSVELKDTDLDDERNDWAESKQFALADDITARGDRRFMRKLMTMITQKLAKINPKFIAPFTVKDLINYYFTSNDPDALYMDDHDRRFFVHEVTCEQMDRSDAAHYKAWKNSEAGIAALWYHLLALDLGDFDPDAPAPATKSKESMVRMGKSDLGAWVRERKEQGEIILKRAGMKGELFSVKELHALYDPSGDKRVTVNAIGRELKRAGFIQPGKGAPIHCPDGSQVTVYAILNGMQWRDAAWGEARDHYVANRPKTTWDIRKGKM